MQIARETACRQPCLPSSSQPRAVRVSLRPVPGVSRPCRHLECSSSSYEHRGSTLNAGRHGRLGEQARHGSPVPPECMQLELPERKSALQDAVLHYYNDVWNAGATDSLDDLVADGVVYSDVLGHECDSFGKFGLRQVINDFQAGHPLAHFTVDETVVDEARATVVAHWHATAAHLLPTAHSGPATGHVSEVSGMDKFHFGDNGRITSIMSFRERFADEEQQPTLSW